MLLLTLSACINSFYIVEAVNRGDYFLNNLSSYDLSIDAGENKLLASTVPTGSEVHFFNMIEGSGGHVLPSNAFNEFTLSATIGNSQKIVYSAVDNDDWEQDGVTKEKHQIIRLTVTDEFLNLP